MPGFPAIGDRIGAYRVDAEIGRGNLGIVFRATERARDRTVALKLLDPRLAADPTFVARFFRGASVLAGLDSPHIVQVFDHGDIDGQAFVAMEYVDGGDVSSLVEREGPLAPLAALQVFTQVVGALGHVHSHGVVHGDVTPSNVLLRAEASEPFAYLCGFGIARTLESSLTRAGIVDGTLAFMSPETQGGADASPSSDLYSAACVLWVMLTGRNPYTGTDAQVAMGHRQSPVPQLPGSDSLIVALNRLLWACLAKSPDERPDSAAEVLTLARSPLALAEGVAPLSISKPDSAIFRRPVIPTDPVPVAPQPPRRARRWLVGAGGAVVAVAVAAWAISGTFARPGAASTPSATAPGQTTSPAVTFECWNGVEVPDVVQCSPPAAKDGLRYLYPSLLTQWDSCTYKAYRPTSDAYDCTIGTQGVIRYRYWDDSDDATFHFTTGYRKANTSRMVLDGTDVGVIYRLDTRVSGVYSMSGFWLDRHFSFSVESATLADREALFTLVEIRALAQINGRPKGADLRTGTFR